MRSWEPRDTPASSCNEVGRWECLESSITVHPGSVPMMASSRHSRYAQAGNLNRGHRKST